MIGQQFENYITQLYRDIGHERVSHNINLKKNGMNCQIDITYQNWFRKNYVECKYKSSPIPLEDIAKFSAVIELFDINPKQSEMITNSKYSKRALELGNKKKIKLYDIEDLIRMEKKRQPWFKQITNEYIENKIKSS